MVMTRFVYAHSLNCNLLVNTSHELSVSYVDAYNRKWTFQLPYCMFLYSLQVALSTSWSAMWIKMGLASQATPCWSPWPGQQLAETLTPALVHEIRLDNVASFEIKNMFVKLMEKSSNKQWKYEELCRAREALTVSKPTASSYSLRYSEDRELLTTDFQAATVIDQDMLTDGPCMRDHTKDCIEFKYFI